MSIPPPLQRQVNGYNRAMAVRNYVLRPVAMVLTGLGITPPIVTGGGLVLMLAFAYLVPRHPNAALVSGTLSVLSDALDGVLARYQNRASDRGKFIDSTFDSVIFMVFIGGVVRAGFLSGLLALAVVTTMGLSRIFRIMVHSQYLPTDWHFRAVAGFVPIAIAFILYALFPVFLITGLNLYPSLSLLSSLVLLIDAIHYFKVFIDK